MNFFHLRKTLILTGYNEYVQFSDALSILTFVVGGLGVLGNTLASVVLNRQVGIGVQGGRDLNQNMDS